MKRYRVIAENVTTPKAWKGNEPDAEAGVIELGHGQVIAATDVPPKSLASLVLNEFVEEVTA